VGLITNVGTNRHCLDGVILGKMACLFGRVTLPEIGDHEIGSACRKVE
jgi:hypothetical protein